MLLFFAKGFLFAQGCYICLLQGVVFFQWIFFERFFFGPGVLCFLAMVFFFCVARCIVSVYFCDDFFVFFC